MILIKAWRIRISIHPLFLFVLASAALMGYFLELIALFTFVIVHELGHLIMARQLGWKIIGVKLLPFGGVLEVDERQSHRAKDEILVAIAGPLQNMWLIIIIYMLGEASLITYDWMTYLIKANIWLVAFNLMPILPLDGGKIVFAILSYFVSFHQTLQWTSMISLICALMMLVYAALYGFLHNGSGPQLNLLIVSSYFIYENWIRYRQLPYLFYRFVLARPTYLNELEAVKQSLSPIIVQAEQKLLDVLKLLKREHLQVICLVEQHNKELKIKSERELMQFSMQANHLHRAVMELFR